MNINSSLIYKNINKDYLDALGHKIHLLENVSIEIAKGKVTSVLAPTGAGKTSLLKIIAGLELPSSGEIKNDSKNIFIPGKPSSFPWLKVINNVSFEIDDKNGIDEIIKFVGLEGYEDHYPNNKSLGFRFRIALARALAHKPDLLVIDEPFNRMTPKIKNEIYLLLRKTNIDKGLTILLGTTTISEAIFLSDRIFLMQKNPGKIVDTINIELPEKRGEELFNDGKFLEIRNRVEESINSNIHNHLLNFLL